MKMYKVLSVALLLGLSGIVHAGSKTFNNKLDKSVTVTLVSPKSKGSKDTVSSSVTLAADQSGQITYDAVNALSVTVADSSNKQLAKMISTGGGKNDDLNNNANFTIKYDANKKVIIQSQSK